MSDAIIEESSPIYSSKHDKSKKFTDKAEAEDYHTLKCIELALYGLFMAQGNYRKNREKGAEGDAAKYAPMFFEADRVGLFSFCQESDMADAISRLDSDQGKLDVDSGADDDSQ